MKERGLPSETEYFGGVEAKLSELAGAPLILSPRDWERVRRWRERSIPLEVVLRALDDVLGRSRAEESVEGSESEPERERPGVRRLRSLAYCERAVEQRFRAQREAAIGRVGAPAPPLSRVRAALRALAAEVESAARRAKRSEAPGPALARPFRALAETLRSAAARAGGEDPIHSVTPHLVEAEAALRAAIQESLGERWEELCSSERRRLGSGLSRMSPQAARQTIEASALRALRDQYAIPPFDIGALHARLQRPRARRRNAEARP